MIYLEVRPHIERDGYHRERFDTVVNGEVILVSDSPAYAGCRELIRRGYSPDELVTVISPSETPWPPHPIGELAQWTVVEIDKSGPYRRKWRPHPNAIASRTREDPLIRWWVARQGASPVLEPGGYDPRYADWGD